MFAIIKTGGKQYKVAANDVIMIERLTGASGDKIEFPDVLMVGKGDSIKVGAPLIADARVHGTVLDQIRDDKVIVFKKTQRHNYRRKNGHRQYLTVIRITNILADGFERTAKPAAKKIAKEAKTPTKKTEATTETPVKETKTAPVKKAPASKKPVQE